MNRFNLEYRVRTTNLNSNLILRDYLNEFTLFSSKYLNYLEWIKILTYFELKIHTEPESIKTIINIKFSINNRRTYFNWDHLNKLYNLHE